jgi:hypothetical protein
MAVTSRCFALGKGTTRGDYPKCQQDCLNQLDKDMKQASDILSTDGRLIYEDKIEEVNQKYNQCITDCKTPTPVK